MDNQYMKEFPPQTFDKVERLLDLLEEMGQHPGLRGKLALHGGTAINLFMLDVPRLSVDIDVSYVGAVSREVMLADRPVIERSIAEVARSQGYSISAVKGGHAGRTFVLGYRSEWGLDHVKVDCIYMNRSPLVPVQGKTSPVRPGLSVPMFSDAELAGGKVKAFYDRVKIRDLYDVGNLGRVISGWREDRRMRAHGRRCGKWSTVPRGYLVPSLVPLDEQLVHEVPVAPGVHVGDALAHEYVGIRRIEEGECIIA